MNNMNYNSPIKYGINNVNPFEFNHGPTFPNSHIPVRANNVASIRSDTNLIRPIPKKIDFSQMIYQQCLDPYAKQPQPGISEMTGVSHNLLSKMYPDTYNNSVPRNNISRKNDIPHHVQNSNVSFSNQRFIFNHYFSQNFSVDNKYYSNTTNIPTDSFMFNKGGRPVSTSRNNHINDVIYMPFNDSKELPLKNNLYEDVKSISTSRFCPNMSVSDDLIENHFSMSLNSQRKFPNKNQASLPVASKQDRNSKKHSKQQVKNIDKCIKILKPTNKPQDILNYSDSQLQNSTHETSETMCATPNDSSISPSSMVSCRSTITPQTVYQNFNNLTSLTPNISNLSSTSLFDKLELSTYVPNNMIPNKTLNDINDSNKMCSSDTLVHGLPLKKRIKWHNEDHVEENCANVNKKDMYFTTNRSKIERYQKNKSSLESSNEVLDTSNNGLNAIFSEDPLKTIPKMFLPMEKTINLTDSDSEDEVIIVDCTNRFSSKDHSDLLFVDNNI